ncbi:MAG: S-layer homology domain-containing protein [Oscillospiraceae bacterium]|nr:S-layer homology domain-containing protein [Oscillospiraceae bacterium]
MKRWISLLLGLTLAVGGVMSAFAEPETAVVKADVEPLPLSDTAAQDERLKNVTELVKGTLDLDTDKFTEFNGSLSEEELGVAWNLNWSGNDASMNIQALDDGTIISYWYNDNQENYRYNPYLPTFPKLDMNAAKNAARAFLDRVLDASIETVTLEEPRTAGQLNSTTAYFSGRIQLNGLPSPLSYSINVRGSDNQITNFHRDAPSQRYLGGIPSATPAVKQSDAAGKLKGTLDLELVYVTANANRPKETKHAVLRYIPSNYEARYVDAQSGELTGAEDYFYYSNDAVATEEAAMADTGGGTNMSRKQLNETELTGVEKLKDVLSTEKLDAQIRTESAYQLDGYKVATSNYRIVKNADETEDIFCTIRYTTGDNTVNEKGIVTRSDRTFRVDAKTGEVKSLSSYSSWDKERTPQVKQSRAQTIAEEFLSRYSKYADKLPLYDVDDHTGTGAPSYGFTFTRKENGYFFPENNCVIQIDAETGAVCGLSFDWDEKVNFDGTENLVSKDAAIDAWMDTYTVTLGYRSKSRKLDPLTGGDIEAKLVTLGYERFQILFLSYGLEREENYPGIDAKTGKPVEPEAVDNEIIYSDIDGTDAASEIKKLADYSVGYTGGEFRPNISLTQWDAVCLIASTRGWRLNPDDVTDEDRNNVYSMIYSMGGLTPDERHEDTVMTRGALVKLLLDCGGYKAVANLNGIFTCDYTDKDSIAAPDIGYAALAQGLGVVKGTYNAKETVRRATAAMLCRMMEREI